MPTQPQPADPAPRAFDTEAQELAYERARRAPGYRTQPLVVETVSGLLPEEDRRLRGAFALAPSGARQQRVAVPTREIVCYECGERSRIPAAALSAHCVHCRAHLNTGDITLKPGSRRLSLRTLGDVTLPAGVELSHLHITCRNLSVSGRGEGSFRCTGTLTLRGPGARLAGQVQASLLSVPSGTRAEISPGVAVEDALIEGRLVGRVSAQGALRIGQSGCLVGDCHTPLLEMEPGARHDGRWVQQR